MNLLSCHNHLVNFLYNWSDCYLPQKCYQCFCSTNNRRVDDVVVNTGREDGCIKEAHCPDTLEYLFVEGMRNSIR